MKTSKKQLLQEIEELISYGGEKPEIAPSLMDYLEPEVLESIRDRLIEKTSKLKKEDREWLQQFRREK